jgi:hypothetical protein
MYGFHPLAYLYQGKFYWDNTDVKDLSKTDKQLIKHSLQLAVQNWKPAR